MAADTDTEVTDPTGNSPGLEPVRTPTWRVRAQQILIVALVIFAVIAIIRDWKQLSHALSQLSPVAVVASIVPAILAMLASLGVWRAIMADLGGDIPLRGAARIFFVSQLGKYVPGSVWSIVTQIELSREYRIPKRTNITVGVLAIAVSTTVGLSLAAATLPFAAPAATRQFWWVALLIPFMLGALHPWVLTRGVNLVLRLLRRPPLPKAPTMRGLLRAAGWQLLNWLCLGLNAWLLVIGAGAPAGRALPVAIGGYALAYSLGLLAIPLPAGAGLRDLALSAALSSVVPGPLALVIALVARVILTAVDMLLAALQYLLPGRR